VATCRGSLILHFDGTVLACTEDEEGDGCHSHEQRHEGSPIRCVDWTVAGCDYCGIQ
jgi:hypothetical protein